ncbi:MAG: biotin/lipoate A/B protein ligase family protein [Thermoplasmata archaeon]
MTRAWRLVDSGVVAPAESAAIDEAILIAHPPESAYGTLHFYRRSSPTVSIGYFQKVSESVDIDECRRRGVALVRRRSGGSSIYTDPGVLIYGLVFGQKDLPGEIVDSFRLICTAIARAVSSFGLEAVYRPPNDVEVGGRKISGNAQLRHGGSVLQHGTVIVDTDLATMDAVLRVPRSSGLRRPSERVTTLASLLGRAPDMDLVKGAIAFELSETFGVRFESSELTQTEVALAEKLVTERYGKDEWNLRL